MENETEKQIDLSDPESVEEEMKKNNQDTMQMKVYVIFGIFGELPNCDGIAQELINTPEKLKKYGLDPEEGGTFIKLMGCSYLYRGDPATEKVKGIEQAKSNVSVLPRNIIGKSTVLSLAFAFLYFFYPRRFWNYICIFAEEIRTKTMVIHDIPSERYNAPAKEIWRAMDVILKKRFDIPQDKDLLNETDWGKMRKNPIPYALMKLTAFFCLFIELDGAYRFPTQDMFGELKKNNLTRKSGCKEAIRILGILLERNANEGTSQKFLFVKRVLNLALIINPRMGRIIHEFLMELNIDKVKLNDADWYFCLRRTSYNYKGQKLDQRLRELHIIDKEKNHKYFNIQLKQVEHN